MKYAESTFQGYNILLCHSGLPTLMISVHFALCAARCYTCPTAHVVKLMQLSSRVEYEYMAWTSGLSVNVRKRLQCVQHVRVPDGDPGVQRPPEGVQRCASCSLSHTKRRAGAWPPRLLPASACPSALHSGDASVSGVASGDHFFYNIIVPVTVLYSTVFACRHRRPGDRVLVRHEVHASRLVRCADAPSLLSPPALFRRCRPRHALQHTHTHTP